MNIFAKLLGLITQEDQRQNGVKLSVMVINTSLKEQDFQIRRDGLLVGWITYSREWIFVPSVINMNKYTSNELAEVINRINSLNASHPEGFKL